MSEEAGPATAGAGRTVRGRFAQDCLLAAGATLATFMLLATLSWVRRQAGDLTLDTAQWWRVTAVCCLQAMLLCLRRIRPLWCLGLVAASQVLVVAVAPAEGTVRSLAPFVSAYTVATILPVRAALAAAGAAVLVEAVGTVAVMWVVDAALLVGVSGHLLSGAAAFLGSAFVGTYVATRRRYLALVLRQADEAISAEAAKVEAAIGAERSRMARELHDVAAHHLSGMVVQAAAVERQIDSDPQAAKDGAVWIRRQGKETLDNLRLVVGVLRGRSADDDGGDPGGGERTAPVPGLARLDDLVSTARNLATPVELVREGQPRDLPPIADVALYRVAQEALSNARQHAPGAPVRVVLRFLPREVSLEVVNDPGPRIEGPAGRAGGGVGLIGMRERAQLIGATFAAGPVAAGGWRVTMTLPTTREGARLVSPTRTTAGDIT